MPKRVHKEVREVLNYARSLGFTVQDKLTGKGHIKLVLPNGTGTTVPCTPGKYTWRRNAMAELRRLARQYQTEQEG